MTGTAIMGTIRPNTTSTPPTIAPRMDAAPCAAPTPAMPFTRVASSVVTAAMCA